jgi:hypothetical protein
MGQKEEKEMLNSFSRGLWTLLLRRNVYENLIDIKGPSKMVCV